MPALPAVFYTMDSGLRRNDAGALGRHPREGGDPLYITVDEVDSKLATYCLLLANFYAIINPSYQKERKMTYLEIIRNIRRILFTGFLVNVAIVSVCWIFIWTHLMEYFMWTMPGYTIDMANDYIMWLAGFLHIISIALFLIPAIALSIEIACEKKRLIREEQEWEEFKAYMMTEEYNRMICEDAGIPYPYEPVKKKTAAKKKAPVKKVVKKKVKK